MKSVNGKTTVYTYNELNQLVSDSDTSYEYDLNGNLIRVIGSANSALYEYNSENKLVKATVQNGELVIVESYTYDYEGNRTSKITRRSDGKTEYVKYLNDNSALTNVLVEVDSNGNIKAYYTIGNDLLSQERDGKVSVYLYDGHGSVVGLADENGAVTDTYTYDAFGNLLKSTGTTANNYRYCGEQFDETTGLYYLRARYMDTSTGRFISQDSYAGSISDPVSLHKYLYANANPVTNVDPSGYCVAAIPSKPEMEYNKNIIMLYKEMMKDLRMTVSGFIVKNAPIVALTILSLTLNGLTTYLTKYIIQDSLKKATEHIKSPVLIRALSIVYASLLESAISWAFSRSKTNNDYDNKMARHHIVPQGMFSAFIPQLILVYVGINGFTYNLSSPNIVVIKYSTHYAIHSNNELYVTTVDTAIVTAFLDKYSDGYIETCESVRIALEGLRGLILTLDMIIP